MEFKRKIFYYKSYFLEFYKKQDPKVKLKINWAIGLVSELEMIPSKIFKHIEGTDGLYELGVSGQE